jgi:hypothetical protein
VLDLSLILSTVGEDFTIKSYFSVTEGMKIDSD